MTDDPFAHLPPLPADLGNSLWKGAGEGLQATMDGIIEQAGNLLGAAVNKTIDVGAKGVNGTLAVVDKGMSAMSPTAVYDMVRTPSTPGMDQGPSKGGHGLGRSMEVETPNTQRAASSEVGGRSNNPSIQEFSAQDLGTNAQHGISFNGKGGQSQGRSGP